MIWSALIYTSLYLFIIWLSLAVTIGIFYCADLAEEHPTLFGLIIKYSIWGVLALHVILFFEGGLPYSYIVLGMLAHGCYYQLLKDYPRVQGITNPWLVGSIAMMVIDNACWLWHFYYHYFTMMEILCFGQLLLWLVPFLYMISLSVNDNVLPGLGVQGAGGGMGGGRGSNEVSLKGLFAYLGFGSRLVTRGKKKSVTLRATCSHMNVLKLKATTALVCLNLVHVCVCACHAHSKDKTKQPAKQSYYNPHAAAPPVSTYQGPSSAYSYGSAPSESHMTQRGASFPNQQAQAQPNPAFAPSRKYD